MFGKSFYWVLNDETEARVYPLPLKTGLLAEKAPWRLKAQSLDRNSLLSHSESSRLMQNLAVSIQGPLCLMINVTPLLKLSLSILGFSSLSRLFWLLFSLY